jgi:photosystem II stability/assembly factor-like uncharacterized protein
MAVRSETGFWEDMSLKAEWFYGIRGRLSDQELNRKLHSALDHVDLLRESRTLDLDPGGGTIKESFGLVGAGRQARAEQVELPHAGASDGFVTAAVKVEGVPAGGEVYVKLKPKRGASSTFELGSATAFVYDEKLRQWNLVERSGYNARSRYVWALAHRDGIYAAIALPADPVAARRLALERFAYHHIQYGIEAGLYTRADDYFADKQAFRQVAAQEHDLGSSKSDVERLRELAAVQRETVQLRGDWRGQLPNGGLPEWHLMEHLASFDPDVLVRLEIGDLFDRFPWIFHLANRVGRWYPNGPWNINGRVKSLVIDPANSSVLYAGAANGGVWKTSDGGQTWRHLWTFQDTMAVGALALGRRSARRRAPAARAATIYAATGEDTPNYGPSYGGVGIYKSTDDGANWTRKSDAATLGARCSRIVLHPANPDVVYLASETGVHKSTDGGDTWTRQLGGHATDLVLAHDQPDTLYAGLWGDGLYKTTDAGAHWVRNTNQVTFNLLFATIRFPFPSGADAGWIKLALGRNGAGGSNLLIAKLGKDGARTLISTDGGASWGISFASEAVEYDEWTSFVAIHPNNSQRIYLGGLGLQYSTTGWDFRQSNGSHSDHHAIVFDPHNDAVCYTCCDGGVYKSNDFGANWALASRYLQATQLASLGVSQSGTFVAGSATQDQGIIQTDGSLDWSDFGGGNEWGMFVVDPNDSNNIYISPGSGQLRRSSDRGHTYSNPTQGLTDFWPSQNRQTQPASFAHVAVRPGISNFLIGAAVVAEQVKDADGNVTDSYGPIRRLYYSRDWGQSWWNAHEIPSNPTRVAYAPSDNQRAYAATVDGRFYRNDHAGQLGWYEPASAANKPPAAIITGITVDHNDADTVYITYGNNNPHIYRTTDGGKHWTAIAGIRPDMSLPDIAASALEIDPENSDILYIGTDVGVFRSNDAGATWYPYNDSVGDYDLPKVIVSGLGLQRAGNRLFASTMGRGLYYTYTTGLPWLRVVAISHNFRGRRQRGIQYLRLTDGAQTYLMTRAEVIRRIEAGTNVYTHGADGSRAEVVVMPPGPEHPIDYLMTPADATRANNLLSMPEF